MATVALGSFQVSMGEEGRGLDWSLAAAVGAESNGMVGSLSTSSLN